MTCPRCEDNAEIEVSVGEPDYFGNWDTVTVPCPDCTDSQEEEEEPCWEDRAHWKDGDYPDPWSGG